MSGKNSKLYTAKYYYLYISTSYDIVSSDHFGLGLFFL
jgi:hypothetical protein